MTIFGDNLSFAFYSFIYSSCELQENKNPNSEVISTHFDVFSFFLFFAETAMLLPGKYAPKTSENSIANKYDVRSNLRSYTRPVEKERYVIQYNRVCCNKKRNDYF